MTSLRLLGASIASVACLGLSVATAAAPAASPPQNDYLLVLDLRAGPYRYLESFKKGGEDTYSAALAAFGKPSRFRAEGNLCRVTWATAGVSVGFASANRPCRTEQLFSSAWYGMTLFGRRWHTRAGIRVGMSVVEVRRRYRGAGFDVRSRRPWLVLLRSRDAELNFVHLAVAVNRRGHVTSIEVPATYVY